jgi:hypothetical protein
MKRKFFAELNLDEKSAVCNFVLDCIGDYGINRTPADINNFFSSIIFESGKSLFCFSENGKPLATFGAVVKDVIYKGEIFITAINIASNNQSVFLDCYREVENYLRQFQPKTIKLGVSHYYNYLVPYIKEAGFINPYHLAEMTFIPSGKTELNPDIIMEPLNELNKTIYREINNAAFLTCPNGGVISEKDTENFIEDYRDNPD